MKKSIVVFLVLILISFSSFASTQEVSPNTDPGIYGALKSPYKNLDVRSLGMGGVGIASPSSTQSIWLNPAGLGDKKLQISLPSFGVTLYNDYALKKAGLLDSAFSGKFDTDKAIDTVFDILSSGYGKIADVNAGVSFSGGGFGFGVAVQDSILTYAPLTSTGGISSNIINQLNIDIRLGYGFKLNFSESFSLDMGLSLGFNYLLYNKSIDGDKVLELMTGDSKDLDSILNGIPFMAGWAIPINVGMRLNMPLGFSFATAVNNINGRYYMKTFDSYKDVLKSPFGGNDKFKLDTDISWDMGVAWTLDWSRLFRPTVEVDIVDLWGLFTDGSFSGRSFMNHLKIGAEIKTLWVLDIRGGLDSGYWTLGAGLDFYALRVEAAYYWHEFGDVAGDKGIDGLTIQFNLGW